MIKCNLLVTLMRTNISNLKTMFIMLACNKMETLLFTITRISTPAMLLGLPLLMEKDTNTIISEFNRMVIWLFMMAITLLFGLAILMEKDKLPTF
jgi:hypothetical protein